MTANHRPTANLYVSCVRTLLGESGAAAPYESLLRAGAKPLDLLAKLVTHLDAINMSAASEEEKEKARDELLRFVEANMMFPATDNGLTFADYTPHGFQRESVNEQVDLNEWGLPNTLRALFGGNKKKPAKPRRPRMPKATSSASMRPATAPKPTPSMQPRKPLFGAREWQPQHGIHYHEGLRVFGGHIGGQPLGRSMSERALYGHLTSKLQYSHQPWTSSTMQKWVTRIRWTPAAPFTSTSAKPRFIIHAPMIFILKATSRGGRRL
jgi:hypothetical protein